MNEPNSKDAIVPTKSTRSRFNGYCSQAVRGNVAPQPPIVEKLKPIEGDQLKLL